jgi:hypothetical protein
VRELLTGKEKEKILAIIQFNGSHKLIELVHLYKSQNAEQKAIDVIKSWLEKSAKSYGDENVYSVYLDLLNKTQQSISEVAKEALTHCANISI